MIVGLEDQEQFTVELEFLQSLANPAYLSCKRLGSIYLILLVLSLNGYLSNEKFLAYLRYLQYWNRPEYARHIQY